MRFILKHLKNYNFIFILGMSVLIFVFFPNFAKAASISGGACEAPSGQSCTVTITGDLSGYGAADWEGTLWFSDTGLQSSPIVVGGGTFSYNRSIPSGTSAQVSLVIHGPPPDGWGVNDSSCCGPVTIVANSPASPPVIDGFSGGGLAGCTDGLPGGNSIDCNSGAGSGVSQVGQPTTYTIQAHDSDGEVINVGVNWGDGTSNPALNFMCAPTTSPCQLQFSHTYSSMAGNPYNLIATVTDGGGKTDTVSAAITVISVPILNLSNNQRDFVFGGGRPGPGWTISNGTPDSIIDWNYRTTVSDPRAALPSNSNIFNTITDDSPATPVSTDFKGEFNECAGGTRCSNWENTGHKSTYIRIPSGNGLVSGEVDYRVWTSALRLYSSVDNRIMITRDPTPQTLLIPRSQPVWNISGQPHHPDETGATNDGLPHYDYPSGNFVVTNGNWTASTIPLRYSCVGVIANGIATEKNCFSNTTDTFSSTPILGISVPATIEYRYNDTRIKVMVTLNGYENPWTGILPRSYTITSNPNSATITGSSVPHNYDGVELSSSGPVFTIVYPKGKTGPSDSKLANVSFAQYDGGLNRDILNSNGIADSAILKPGGMIIFTLNFTDDGQDPSGAPPPPPIIVAGNPNLSVSPTTLDFFGTVGGANPNPQEVTISNTVSGTSLDWTAVKNCPNTTPCPWLSLSAPTAGTLSGDSSTPLAINVDTTGLAIGFYSAPVTISCTTDCAGSPQTVTVNLDISSSTGSRITLSCTNNCNFSATAGGPNPSDQTLGITNSDSDTLIWNVSDDAFWLTLGTISGSTAAGTTSNVPVSVNIAGLPSGTYNALVTVSGTARNSPQTQNVTLTIGGKPRAIIECNDQALVPPNPNSDCIINQGESIEFLNKSTP